MAFDPRNYLLAGDQIKSIARAMVEGALTEAAKTESGVVILLGQNGEKFAALPLDSFGNILANVIMRNGLGANLKTLQGTLGELGVPTDINGVIRYTGVAGEAELLDHGAHLNYDVPAATAADIAVTTQLQPHTVLYINPLGAITGNPTLTFQLGYTPDRVGQRYRVVNRSAMSVVILYNNNSQLMSRIPPYSAVTCTSEPSTLTGSGFTWAIEVCEILNVRNTADTPFIFNGAAGSSTAAPLQSTAFGFDLMPSYKGQTLIGQAAEAVGRNSFAYGLPETQYKTIQYHTALQKSVTTASGTGILTVDAAAVGTDNIPLLATLSSYTAWSFDIKVIVKQASSENCGVINARAVVTTTSAGVSTLRQFVVDNEYWNGISLTAAACLSLAVNNTVKGLEITVTNPSTAVSLRWVAWLSVKGRTNL